MSANKLLKDLLRWRKKSQTYNHRTVSVGDDEFYNPNDSKRVHCLDCCTAQECVNHSLMNLLKTNQKQRTNNKLKQYGAYQWYNKTIHTNVIGNSNRLTYLYKYSLMLLLRRQHAPTHYNLLQFEHIATLCSTPLSDTLHGSSSARYGVPTT